MKEFAEAPGTFFLPPASMSELPLLSVLSQRSLYLPLRSTLHASPLAAMILGRQRIEPGSNWMRRTKPGWVGSTQKFPPGGDGSVRHPSSPPPSHPVPSHTSASCSPYLLTPLYTSNLPLRLSGRLTAATLQRCTTSAAICRLSPSQGLLRCRKVLESNSILPMRGVIQASKPFLLPSQTLAKTRGQHGA